MDRRNFLIGALAVGSCGVAPKLPNVQALYRYTSELDPALRRPIVTLPGVLGSRLREGRDGPYLWGGPKRLAADSGKPESLRLVALPIGEGSEPLSALTDGVRAEGVLRRANASLLGSTVEQQVYEGMVAALNAGGYRFSRTWREELAQRGENSGSFEFPYDWRRDIVEAAKGLYDFIERKAEQVHRVRMAQYGRAPDAVQIRFDFVAHSMGALVLRYYLMYGDQDLPADGSAPVLNWAGARRAACAILVAPPNLGSVSAFETLVNGRDFGLFQPRFSAALVGTFPSLYQLLPRDRHRPVRLGAPDGPAVGSLYDADMWEENGWGLMDPAQDGVLGVLMPESPDAAERRRRSRAYLTRVLGRAAQFHRAMDIRATPTGTDLFLVVGTGVDTPAAAVIDPKSRRVSQVAVAEGDGVVLRASALSDERQGGHVPADDRSPIQYRTVLLLPGEHVSLTHNPVFADNLLYWLLDAPRARAGASAAEPAATTASVGR